MLRALPGADVNRVDIALEEFCQAEQILFLNLTYNMLEWQGDFESLWLKCGHLSPAGHDLVAEILFDVLRSDNLFPKQL